MRRLRRPASWWRWWLLPVAVQLYSSVFIVVRQGATAITVVIIFSAAYVAYTEAVFYRIRRAERKMQASQDALYATLERFYEVNAMRERYYRLTGVRFKFEGGNGDEEPLDPVAYARAHFTSPGGHALLDEVERGQARDALRVLHEAETSGEDQATTKGESDDERNAE